MVQYEEPNVGGYMSIVEKAEARTSVELVDSCNCNECCPRSCGCWPRRVKPHRKHGGHIPPEQQRQSDHIADQASKVAQEMLNDQLKDK
jgi:hypothetical protein